MHPMHAIKTYWHTLYSSLSNPDYYFLLLKTRLRLSISFFLVTTALIAVAVMLWIRFQAWPLFVAGFATTGDSFVQQIPEDARFTYADGTLETNLESPFILKSPEQLIDAGFASQLVGIHEKDEPLDSFITFGRESIFLRTSSEVDSLSYKNIFENESAEFFRPDIEQFLDTSVQFLNDYVWHIHVILALIWFVTRLIEGMIIIALYAFIIQSLGWIMDVRLKYAQVFRWGMHIYPIALAADLLSASFAQTGIPMMSIVYLTFSLVILWRGRTLQRTIQRV